jgi:hypothetical protein
MGRPHHDGGVVMAVVNQQERSSSNPVIGLHGW